MNKFLIIVFSVYLFKSATAYCCYRDPWILPTTPCTTTNPCTCNCDTNTSTNCYTPCKCFRDPANVCETCDQPSPLCQCLAKCGCDGLKYPLYFPEVEYPATLIETCDQPSPMCQCLSDCGGKGLKNPLYFPEVDYPATIIEMDPFFYKTCFTY